MEQYFEKVFKVLVGDTFTLFNKFAFSEENLFIWYVDVEKELKPISAGVLPALQSPP